MGPGTREGRCQEVGADSGSPGEGAGGGQRRPAEAVINGNYINILGATAKEMCGQGEQIPGEYIFSLSLTVLAPLFWSLLNFPKISLSMHSVKLSIREGTQLFNS